MSLTTLRFELFLPKKEWGQLVSKITKNWAIMRNVGFWLGK